ncbi:MAG: hypothetical protein MK538_14325, partial [Planctomycetes bacterium]|nr:hypothetical protein [Planctomycetota bacterium]
MLSCFGVGARQSESKPSPRTFGPFWRQQKRRGTRRCHASRPDHAHSDSLSGNPQPESLAQPIGPDDALLIIDMQHDFLLKDAVTNPDGGRFGSP